MDKMLYVAMTGASQNARAQQAHANNLANISTTGFRRDFEQARSMQVFGDSYPARVYAMSERPGTDFTAGALQETGRDLDVAIEGEGWVAVQAPDGNEAYVRTGSLNIDALGMLRAANGMPVLGKGQPDRAAHGGLSNSGQYRIFVGYQDKGLNRGELDFHRAVGAFRQPNGTCDYR